MGARGGVISWEIWVGGRPDGYPTKEERRSIVLERVDGSDGGWRSDDGSPPIDRRLMVGLGGGDGQLIRGWSAGRGVLRTRGSAAGWGGGRGGVGTSFGGWWGG